MTVSSRLRCIPPRVYVTWYARARDDRETLEILWRDKSMNDMTVEDGIDYFKAVPAVRENWKR